MFIEIDENSGFCFGVVNAISIAEKTLKQKNKIYCLGDIVHNDVEVKRLRELGMDTISHSDFTYLKGESVLIRAHGEPPATYKDAKEKGIEIIDATCPVVLKLQKKIKKAYMESRGQILIVIYGKKGHAEVNGLVGQTDNQAFVIESLAEIDEVDTSKPIALFSQTTMPIDNYYAISDALKSKGVDLIFNDTICRKVSNRIPNLIEFSKRHDVILFVSGKKSSNGKVLHGICKENNKNTYLVETSKQIKVDWFKNVDSVGITGATSTPKWLMEEVLKSINKLK